MKKKKTKTLAQLKRSLDTIFSRYVRLSAADDNGYVQCYTCESIKPWKEVDAGHFQSRKWLPSRFHLSNVKPQCKRCNIFSGGQQYVFGKLLDLREGEGTAEKMYKLARASIKYTRADYEEEIEYYKNKVDELLNG
tara:strand:+ start:194 stop:601 length:408 start_codon:yes stop_codon:yes gene_type:complete